MLIQRKCFSTGITGIRGYWGRVRGCPARRLPGFGSSWAVHLALLAPSTECQLYTPPPNPEVRTTQNTHTHTHTHTHTRPGGLCWREGGRVEALLPQLRVTEPLPSRIHPTKPPQTNLKHRLLKAPPERLPSCPPPSSPLLSQVNHAPARPQHPTSFSPFPWSVQSFHLLDIFPWGSGLRLFLFLFSS